MIYTELTNKAMQVAFEAHLTQQDTGGIPYIFHPYHLAEQMNNEARCCIALLHDVVEDSHVTIEELEEDFPPRVIEALKLLRHDIQIDYYKYIEKICKNTDASFVKMADLIHNMTEDRLLGTDISEEEKNRWFQKYIWALKMITDELSKEIIIAACEDDIQWHLIWKQYPKMSGKVILAEEAKIEKYLDSRQIDILKGKPLSEQIAYFEIEITKEKGNAVLKEYCNVETVEAEQFIKDHDNLVLLLSDGCVVGFLDINMEYNRDYCKKLIEAIYVNSYRVCRYCKNWIDHSWDHYAANYESVSYRMRWKEK